METYLELGRVDLHNGLIRLPEWCKRVKIDVGLSYNGPQSAHWVNSDPNLVVFGFEPVPKNLESLRQIFYHSNDEERNRKYRSQLFIIPIALGDNYQPKMLNMFVTANDGGCSSLLEPKDFEIAEQITVPVFRIADFFDWFPFNHVANIDHLKTDCQGSDAQVIGGIGDYIERIFAITCEAETSQYKGAVNSIKDIQSSLKSINFKRLDSKLVKSLPLISYVEDPTWVNEKAYKVSNRRDLYLFQKG